MHVDAGNVNPTLDILPAPRAGYGWCQQANRNGGDREERVDYYGCEQLVLAEDLEEDANVGEESDDEADLYDFQVEVA